MGESSHVVGTNATTLSSVDASCYIFHKPDARANFKILSIEKFFNLSAPITGFPKIAVRGPARPGHVVIT